MEKNLQNKGHEPYFFPTLIPEENLKKESSHIGGFTPEVFWVTHGGEKKFEERLALRPTSETAFYEMFGLWIRSYKDLPFKTYQRAQVFRYETKATRPFLRSREFHWIERHSAHATEDDAFKQVLEDMNTTKEVLHDIFGIPFIFFERPVWDKFPGASRTFAADALNPNGKVIQLPSTHMISPEFSKAFNVKFMDKDESEKYAHITCYGPAISRIFASVIIVHGDDKGLKFPWDIAPVQVMIVPITDDKRIIKKAKELKKHLIKKADKIFEGRIKDAKNLQEIKKATEEGFIAKCNFCSVDKEGISCAKIIETETGAEVRGTMLDEKNKAIGKCAICNKEAKQIVYIAKSY